MCSSDLFPSHDKHIQYKTVENKSNFEGNLEFFNKELEKEKQFIASPEYQTIFKDFISDLPEFQYLSKQNQFALAKINTDFGLLKNLEIKKRYLIFLGLPRMLL